MPNPEQPQAGTGTSTTTTTTPGTGTGTSTETTPGTETPPGTGDEPPPSEEDDLSKLTPEQLKERLEKEIKERQKANREAQTLRTRATTAEGELKKRTDAEKTDLEKAQDRIKELETANGTAATEALNGKIIAAAAKAGFNDPNDAVALINRSEIADDASNLADLVKQVLKDKPYLGKGKTTTPTGGGGNPADQVNEAEVKQKVEKATSQFSTIGRLAKMRGQ